MSETKKLEELVEINKKMQSEIDYLLEKNRKLQSENQEVVKNWNKLRWYSGGVEAATDGIIVIVDDVITHVNKNLCDMIGKSFEEFVGSHYLINIHPDEKPKVKKRFQKHKWDEGVSLKFESSMIDKNKKRIYVFIQVSYIPFGESIAYLCVLRNITNRKKAEMTLRESEEKYRLLVETSIDLIIKTDMEGKIQFFNKAAMNTLGYSPEELYLKNYIELIHPDDFQSVVTEYEQLLEHKKSITLIEYRLLRKNGQNLHVNTSLAPIIDNHDNIVAFLGSSRDISDRKAAEEELNIKTKALERSNNELQQFAYVASHDLKAPLQTVQGYIRLIKRNNKDSLNEKSMQHLGSAIEGLNRMKVFIDDLLNYSQVSNSPKQDFKPIDFNKLLKFTLSNLEATIKENEVDIKIIVTDDYPHVLGDIIQLSQLFQNLILNGIKFVKDRSPEIRIGSEEKDGFYHFFVSDNGIGIDSKNFDKIFKIFRRLHSTFEFSGNGIGLATCKKIVERHGGEIWVESEIGKGSTFWFSIPKVNKK